MARAIRDEEDNPREGPTRIRVSDREIGIMGMIHDREDLGHVREYAVLMRQHEISHPLNDAAALVLLEDGLGMALVPSDDAKPRYAIADGRKMKWLDDAFTLWRDLGHGNAARGYQRANDPGAYLTYLQAYIEDVKTREDPIPSITAKAQIMDIGADLSARALNDPAATPLLRRYFWECSTMWPLMFPEGHLAEYRVRRSFLQGRRTVFERAQLQARGVVMVYVGAGHEPDVSRSVIDPACGERELLYNVSFRPADDGPWQRLCAEWTRTT